MCSTLSPVVLETVSADQQGSASASMQLSSVLGSALGTGFGGVIIGLAAAAGRSPRSGLMLVDIVVIAVVDLAILTAVRLPGRPIRASL